jgi:hypothetical protein
VQREAARLVLVLAASIVFQSTGALANSFLVEGRRLVQELRFSEAVVKLELARRAPTQELNEQLEILDLLGRSLIAEGQSKRAREAYEELLRLAPSFMLEPGAPPKIGEVFLAAKKALYPSDFVELGVDRSKPLNPRFKLKDPWNVVSTLQLAHFDAEKTVWIETDYAIPFTQLPEVPRDAAWKLSARSSRGVALARLQSDAHLVDVSIRPEPVAEKAKAPSGPSFSVRPALVIGAAGLALGAAVTAVILHARTDTLEAQARTSEWADDGRAKHAAAGEAARLTQLSYTAAAVLGATSLVLYVTW